MRIEGRDAGAQWTAAGILGVFLLAAPLAAGVITFKDGRVETVLNVFSESDDAVWVVGTDHKLTKLARKDVAKIVTTEEQRGAYETRAAALASDDAAGHLKLAEWCFAQMLDGAGRRELRRAATGGDAATARATLRMAMAHAETSAARLALDRLKALQATDAWTARAADTVDALRQVEEREQSARAEHARRTAEIAQAAQEIASLTAAINNPIRTVTHEERAVCPRCWGAGRITTVSNSLPQNADQQHIIGVHSIGDGAYDTYTVPLVITQICPQCQGRRYIVTTTRTQERIDTTAQARRREELQKGLDAASAARDKAVAALAEATAQGKRLTAELLAEVSEAPR